MTIDGAMVNFLVYYEMDEDLSRHVLGLDTYAPSGPANSWVLLAPVGAEEAAEASRTSAAAAPADDGHGKKRKKDKNEPAERSRRRGENLMRRQQATLGRPAEVEASLRAEETPVSGEAEQESLSDAQVAQLFENGTSSQQLQMIAERPLWRDSTTGWTLLHLAAFCGAPLQVVRAAIAAHPVSLRGEGGTLTVEGELPLNLACRCQANAPGCRAAVVMELLKRHREGAKMADCFGELPLHNAARDGHHWAEAGKMMEVVEKLVEAHPVALHQRNCKGKTPLALAKGVTRTFLKQIEQEQEQEQEQEEVVVEQEQIEDDDGVVVEQDLDEVEAEVTEEDVDVDARLWAGAAARGWTVESRIYGTTARMRRIYHAPDGRRFWSKKSAEASEQEVAEQEAKVEDTEEPAWDEVEAITADLTDEHPSYGELVGSDVCVLAAAFEGETLTREGAIGWRGQVTAKHSGKVQVFGSWFKLHDTSFILPIQQEGVEGAAAAQTAARPCCRSKQCSKPRGHPGWCDKRRAVAQEEEQRTQPAKRVRRRLPTSPPAKRVKILKPGKAGPSRAQPRVAASTVSLSDDEAEEGVEDVQCEVSWARLPLKCALTLQRLTDPAKAAPCQHLACCNYDALRRLAGQIVGRRGGVQMCPMHGCPAKLRRTGDIVRDDALAALLRDVPEHVDVGWVRDGELRLEAPSSQTGEDGATSAGPSEAPAAAAAAVTQSVIDLT